MDYCIQAASNKKYTPRISKSCEKHQDSIETCFENGKNQIYPVNKIPFNEHFTISFDLPVLFHGIIF